MASYKHIHLRKSHLAEVALLIHPLPVLLARTAVQLTEAYLLIITSAPNAFTPVPFTFPFAKMV